MKRVLSILFALCITLVAMADAKGHYWLDVEEQNIPVENITNYFSEWFNLGEGVTFTVFNDETDNIGMRHIAYQQYIGGVKAEHQMILVHAREGKVVSVNTSVIEAENQPKSIRPRLSKQQAKNKIPSSMGDAELLIITCTIDGVETSCLAYKTIDIANHEDVYIDAETGEVIQRISRVHGADVQGQGYTMYNGWKNMTINNIDGTYFLIDETRQIMTMNATNANTSYLYKFLADPTNNGVHSTPQDVFTYGQESFTSFFNSCLPYYYPTANCSNAILTAVTITNTPDDSWWYSSLDSQIDLYIKIFDNDNNLLYESGYYDDCKLPLTISIPNILVTTAGYTIQIWDYDPLDSDDLGCAITINNIAPNSYSFSHINAIGEVVLSPQSSPELDAHWGMEQTFDFYNNVFNRNGFDNQGNEILQFINLPKDNKLFQDMPLGAFAIRFSDIFQGDIAGMWPDIMVYGLGDGIIMTPVVALDVMAHEFTHLVTQHNGHGGLKYEGESGALNESFSDIMGFSVENYVLGDHDYLIGEDVMLQVPYMRSMKNPETSNAADCKDPQPDTYLSDEHWGNPLDTIDNGHVHTNSGVQNKWFYLLSEGGVGVNDNNDSYNVKGITIQKAQQIAYRNLITYLTPTATHSDARAGSLQAAADLYGKNSQEYISTANAWHAVGVGDAFEDITDTPTGLAIGEYVVVAQRKANTNYFYMTSTPTNGRYTAVDTKTSDLNAVVAKDLGSEYVWTVVKNGETIQLKNGSQFSTWNGGNKAILGNTGKDLTVTANEDGSFTLTFAESETVTRYLSLNADTKYDYFAYYGNTNQIEQLHFLPYTASETTSVEQLTVSDIHAYGIDNTIIIEAVDATPIIVFDAIGQCIFNEVVSSARVPARHGGMYLVKTPTEVVKVIVR